MMKNYRIELKWILIYVGSLLLWMILEKVSGLHDQHIDKHQYLTLVFTIIHITIYVLALRDKRNSFYNGSISYKQVFMTGLIMTVTIALLSPLIQWIISYVISPDYFKTVIDYSLETGYYTTLEEAKAHFNYNNYAIQSSVGALMMGLVFSVIIAFFVKRQ